MGAAAAADREGVGGDKPGAVGKAEAGPGAGAGAAKGNEALTINVLAAVSQLAREPGRMLEVVRAPDCENEAPCFFPRVCAVCVCLCLCVCACACVCLCVRMHAGMHGEGGGGLDYMW